MTDLVNQIDSIRRINNISYIDAVVKFAEEHNIEIELLAESLKKDSLFVSKIQFEAENLNILKKGARLPI